MISTLDTASALRAQRSPVLRSHARWIFDLWSQPNAGLSRLSSVRAKRDALVPTRIATAANVIEHFSQTQVAIGSDERVTKSG